MKTELAEESKTHTRCWEAGRHRKVIWRKVPLGAWLLSYLGVFNCYSSKSYRLYIFVLTFLCYTTYHMSRKPFSVVANVLAPNCTLHNQLIHNNITDDELMERSLDVRDVDPDNYIDGWPPFNSSHCKSIIGAVDYSWLFTYAIFMVGSGLIADRVNLRYFLTIGMIGSGIFVSLLGVAYYAEIHHLAYFIVIQFFVGIFESTGWPGVVAVMGNWFGKRHRGLFLGIWNSHTSVGNILGTAVPSIWAQKGKPWAWSFFVPGFIIILMGIKIFFFLVTDPVHVGLPPSKQHLESEDSMSSQTEQNGNMNTDAGPIQEDERQSFSLTERRYQSDTEDEETRLIDAIETDNQRIINNNTELSEPLEPKKGKAITLFGALKIPGVIEFALSLFFAKMVAYTFLFWLPYYVAYHRIGGRYIGEQKADLLATLYDVGGIIGSIFTGGLSDIINARAISCVIMMYLAVPTLFLYRYLGHTSLAASIALIILSGTFINGPYALITTAVSNDLGTHKSLKDNQKAKATVGGIIDGMGSLGAAFGPLVTGWVSDFFEWDNAFYVLMGSCFLSSLMLTRLLINEIKGFYRQFNNWRIRRREPEDVMLTNATTDESEM